MAENDDFTKEQFADAANDLWGVDVDWTKFSQKELKALSEVWQGDRLDNVIERLFSFAPNPVKLFRKIAVLRVDHGVKKRRDLLKNVADSDTPAMTLVFGIRKNVKEHTEMGGAATGGLRILDFVQNAGGLLSFLEGEEKEPEEK